MTELRPVDSDYRPGYPSRLEDGKLMDLLRPGLLARFSSRTILAGALLAGTTLTGPAEAQDDVPPAPRGTRLDPEFGKEIRDLAGKLLEEYGGEQAFWNRSASIRLARLLDANPPVKYADIPIRYGNSYAGIFDVEGARKATRKLFEKYGIKLTDNVPVKGEGYEFVADGYDEESRTGYEIIMPVGRVGFGGESHEAEPAEKRLDEKELEALGGDVKKGRQRIFVVQATGYPNMDGDLYTPLEYYLASVVDYLDWIHGDRKIDKNRILGNLPGGASRRGWSGTTECLPGCGFEEESDLAHWSVSKGTAVRSEEWSSFGRASLLLTLEPGGRATYTLPEDETLEVSERGASFDCRIYLETADRREVTVTFTVTGSGDDSWVFTEKVASQSSSHVLRYETVSIGALGHLTITTDAERPVRLFVDDIGLR